MRPEIYQVDTTDQIHPISLLTFPMDLLEEFRALKTEQRPSSLPGLTVWSLMPFDTGKFAAF